MESKDYIALEDRYGAHNYHPLDVVIQRGMEFGLRMSMETVTWIASALIQL